MNAVLEHGEVIGWCDIQGMTPPTFTHRVRSVRLTTMALVASPAGPRPQACPRASRRKLCGEEDRRPTS